MLKIPLNQKKLTILDSMKLDQALRLAAKKLNEGSFEEAKSIYLDILLKFPKNKRALQGIRVLKGELPTKLINSQHSINEKMQFILKLYKQGQYREVLAQADNALNFSPNSELLYNVLGTANSELQRFEMAIECYEKAIKINPQYAEAYYNMGNAFHDQGELKSAIDSYNKAINIKPAYFEACSNMGSAQHGAGELKEAIKSYQRAIRIQPNSSKSYNNLGCVLQDKGNIDSAVENYKKAIKIQPNYLEAHYNLGEAFMEIGQLIEAGKCFKKALSLNPKDELGAKIKLASLGEGSVPESTPEHYLKHFYKNRAQSWVENTPQYRGHAMVARAIEQTRIKNNSLKILDLGCGTGSLASFLHSYADTLDGVDISPEMLTRAKKTKFYDNLYEKDLAIFLRNTKSHFDLIVAAAVMIHFLDLKPIFKLVSDKLSPSGSFVISIFKANREQKELNSFMMYSHSDDYIRKIAASLNFKVCYSEHGIHEYHKKKPVDGLAYVLEKIP